MPDIVISNTSPLFYLHRLRCLDLLQKLYHHIIVPEAVFKELTAGRDQGEDAPDVSNYDWIKVRSVRLPTLVPFIADLGAGEAQVLVLSLETPGSLVILDDLLARKIGKLQHLKITGTLGVILKAKQRGYISAVMPLLNRLIQLDFRLSKDVMATILKLAQE